MTGRLRRLDVVFFTRATLYDADIPETGRPAPPIILDGSGRLDTQVGGTGKVLVDIGAPIVETSARSVLDASGRIVISAATGADNDIVIARVLETGIVDRSFGVDGRFVAKLGARGIASNVRLALQPDGRIVAATNLDGAAPELVAFRLWP